MPGNFDNDFADRVREAVDISEVIGDYVTLKRRSAGDFWGLCPFHNEKTPSFHVHSERGIYKCFGCGRGGNAFTFLMEIEGLSFTEALKNIAERVGMEPPQHLSSPAAQKITSDRDRIYNAMQRAAKWFHSRLVGDGGAQCTPESRSALEYLHDRGIDNTIIERYGLGWSEAGWDGLVKAAQRAGITGQTLVQAGLAHQRKDGSGFVDKFRARVIFPIYNLSGKPVAFGARRVQGITPDTDDPKYVNSPETAIYRKGENLYGLYTSREHIRREKFTYLVEGYTDLLALVQADVWNVVASLGTALTTAQARLIGRFARRVHIVYDSDIAGVTAAIRAVDILVLAGLDVRLVRLPEGKDPDNIVRAEDGKALRDILASDLSFIQFRLQAAEFTKKTEPSERIEAVRDLLNTIRAIQDPLRQDAVLKELSLETSIGRETLDKVLKDLKPVSSPDTLNFEKFSLSFSPEAIPERDLISVLLAHPNLASEFMGRLTPSQFTNEILRTIFLKIEQAYIDNEILNTSSLPEQFSDPGIRAFIAEAVFSEEHITVERAREAAEDCLQMISNRELHKKSKELEMRINDASRNKLPTKDLLRELVELRKKKIETERN